MKNGIQRMKLYSWEQDGGEKKRQRKSIMSENATRKPVSLYDNSKKKLQKKSK